MDHHTAPTGPFIVKSTGLSVDLKLAGKNATQAPELPDAGNSAGIDFASLMTVLREGPQKKLDTEVQKSGKPELDSSAGQTENNLDQDTVQTARDLAVPPTVKAEVQNTADLGDISIAQTSPNEQIPTPGAAEALPATKGPKTIPTREQLFTLTVPQGGIPLPLGLAASEPRAGIPDVRPVMANPVETPARPESTPLQDADVQKLTPATLNMPAKIGVIDTAPSVIPRPAVAEKSQGISISAPKATLENNPQVPPQMSVLPDTSGHKLPTNTPAQTTSNPELDTAPQIAVRAQTSSIDATPDTQQPVSPQTGNQHSLSAPKAIFGNDQQVPPQMSVIPDTKGHELAANTLAQTTSNLKTDQAPQIAVRALTASIGATPDTQQPVSPQTGDQHTPSAPRTKNDALLKEVHSQSKLAAPQAVTVGQNKVPSPLYQKPPKTEDPSIAHQTAAKPLFAAATPTMNNTAKATTQNLVSNAVKPVSLVSDTKGFLPVSRDPIEMYSWDPLRTAPTVSATVNPLRADIGPHIARQLIEVVAQASHRPVEIALSPQELGRVRMSVTTEDAVIIVSIIAERPETLDLMRRHIDQLGQSFRAMGYESISFSFGNGDAGSDQSENAGGHDGAPADRHLSESAADQPEHSIIDLDRAPTTGVDIRL